MQKEDLDGNFGHIIHSLRRIRTKPRYSPYSIVPALYRGLVRMRRRLYNTKPVKFRFRIAVIGLSFHTVVQKVNC